MKTIMFCLNPAISHFFPTVILSKALVSRGYRVVYLGFSNLEASVQTEGFEYISIRSGRDSAINELKKRYKFKELAQLYQSLIEEVKQALRKHRVDLMVFDISRFNLYYTAAMESDVPAMSFCTCSGETDINLRIPPNSSDRIPRLDSGFDISGLLWISRYIRREWSRPYTALSKRYYPIKAIRRHAKKQGLSRRYNIDGPYIDVPKLIMGPRHFEFPRSCEKADSYLGLCVDPERSEGELAWAIDPEKPLIYCSLGTSSRRYEEGSAFFKIVIDTMRSNPGWQAIINIGDSEDISKDLDIPEHVYLSNHVPQLHILKKADVVVSHGGYGTIKECIAYAVPMAVFPCIYDQPGNAARVQYHQLGIKGDIHRIQPSELTQMIDSLLNNSIYKERITSLREQIRVLNELNHGIERIENALTGSIS